jgi:hypothetical protein
MALTCRFALVWREKTGLKAQKNEKSENYGYFERALRGTGKRWG